VFSPDGVQPQVFQGTVIVDGLVGTGPEDAIALHEDGQLETVARVFTRPPVGEGGGGPDVIAAPGVETGFVERWVYRDPTASALLTEAGFLMVHDEGHPATCDTIEATVSAIEWTDDPQFSQQVLDYVEPPEQPDEPPGQARQATTFVVHQPDEEGELVPRGWMFRVQAAVTQDHWLLTEDYEPLGGDEGGTYAVVVREDQVPSGELAAWYASHAPEAGSYAVTTYGISPFPDTCIAP